MPSICSMWCGLLLLLWSAASSGAETINVVPGPHGGYRVQTSWGDYIVVLDGNSAWVGTEDEYEHNRVSGMMAHSGYREAVVAIDGRTGKAFVDRDAPRIAVGDIEVSAIDLEILFGSTPNPKLHRPRKDAGEEYVGIAWAQSRAHPMLEMRWLDQKTNRQLRPYRCSESSPFFQCDFVVKRAALLNSGVFIFMAARQTPAAWAVGSIADAQLEGLQRKVVDLAKHDIAASADDVETLKQLHALDPRFPGVFSPDR